MSPWNLFALFSVLRVSPAPFSRSLVLLALPAAFAPAVVSLLHPGLYVSCYHFTVDAGTASRSFQGRLGHTGCLLLEPKSINIRVRGITSYGECSRSENNKMVACIHHVESLIIRLCFVSLVPTELDLANRRIDLESRVLDCWLLTRSIRNPQPLYRNS